MVADWNCGIFTGQQDAVRIPGGVDSANGYPCTACRMAQASSVPHMSLPIQCSNSHAVCCRGNSCWFCERPWSWAVVPCAWAPCPWRLGSCVLGHLHAPHSGLMTWFPRTPCPALKSVSSTWILWVPAVQLGRNCRATLSKAETEPAMGFKAPKTTGGQQAC